MRAPRCTAWAARLTSAVSRAHVMATSTTDVVFRNKRSATIGVSGLVGSRTASRGPARDNARVTSTASVELLGLHLPRAAAAAPVAMRSPSHTMCHQMRCVAHTMSPCATHSMCHAPHTKRAPAAVISRVARPHDAMGSVHHMSHAALLRTRGRQAVAAMHLTLGAHGEAFHSAHQLLPARASVAPACQGRAQTTDAAVRALPPLRRRYALASNPPLGPACPAAHLHGHTSSSYRRTSEQCFSAAHSPDPPC